MNSFIKLPSFSLGKYKQIKSQGRGELLISLCWQPAAARLTVVLLKARNLPRMDVTGLADPYVKIYLLYNVRSFCELHSKQVSQFFLLTGTTNRKEEDARQETNAQSSLQRKLRL